MSVTAAAGFEAAGVVAGLKSTGARDVALVRNLGPLQNAAAVFTSNRCKANPVLWSEQVMRDGTVAAIVLNSGGANCYTGAKGFQVTHSTAELVGEAGDVVGPGEVVVGGRGFFRHVCWSSRVWWWASRCSPQAWPNSSAWQCPGPS